MWFKVIYLLLFFIYFLSFKSFSQERKIEKKVYSNFREGKLDVALSELDNLYDKYNMKSFFYYWKAYIYMAKLSELKKFDNTIINRDSASYYIEKSLSLLSDAPLYLISEDLNIDKIEFDILFPGCNVNPPIGEKKYTNCLSLIKNDFKLKKEAINELKYNLLLSEKIEEFKTSNKDINSFLKEIKPRVKLVPAKNPLFGEVAKSSYMELANIRNQRELVQLQKELIDKNWINYIKTYKEEEYLSIVPELEKMINNYYLKNLENQYQKIKNNPYELKVFLTKLEESKKLIEANPLNYTSNMYGDIKFSNFFIDIRKVNYYKIYNEASTKQKENLDRQKKIEEEFSYTEIFEENFEKNINGWYESEDQNAINKITKSKFVFENKTGGGFINLAAKRLPTLNQDFIISINTTWLKGIDNNSYHILWGANGFSNYFSFGITANGLYRYSNINNGNYQDVIPLTTSEHINRNGSNIISVRRNSDKIEFYINYFKVNELEYSEFYGDQLGMSVTGPQRIEFDDLKVAFTETVLGDGESVFDSEEERIRNEEAIELGKIRWEHEIELSRLASQSENEEKSHNDGYGSGVKDINGNTYKTVYIGTQEWMAENLKVSKYNDGTTISNITDGTQWSNLTTGAWAYYNNDAANNAKYGKLYNWYAVSPTTNGNKNVCPTGWHVPTNAEWTILTDYLGGQDVAGGKLKEVGTTNWNSPNMGSTNTSLFTGLPGGHRHNGGDYKDIGSYGYWWSSTEYVTYNAWFRTLGINFYGVDSRINCCGNSGFSVRCLRD